MRLVASAALFLLFMILPLLVRRIRGVLTARQSIVLSVTMLVGMVVTFLGLLGAVVAPTGLGLPNALAAVEICLTAGSKLFQHPLKHWPSILAALLLLAFLGRIVIGVVATAKDARRARPGPGVDAEPLGAGGRVLIVSSAEPLAYTTGILRPRIVISSGLRASLSAAELAAVIAHEQRHASGGHVPLLFLARVVRRAFGSIPPTRIATEQLAMALRDLSRRDGCSRGWRPPGGPSSDRECRYRPVRQPCARYRIGRVDGARQEPGIPRPSDRGRAAGRSVGGRSSACDAGGSEHGVGHRERRDRPRGRGTAAPSGLSLAPRVAPRRTDR